MLISNIQKEYNSSLGKKTNVHNFTHSKLCFKIHKTILPCHLKRCFWNAGKVCPYIHNFTHFKLCFKIHNCSVDMFNHSHGIQTTLSLKILIILQHSQILFFYKKSFVAELYNIYLWHLVNCILTFLISNGQKLPCFFRIHNV